MTDDHDGGASQCCNGVQIGTQYLRNLGEENVPHHAATDAG